MSRSSSPKPIQEILEQMLKNLQIDLPTRQYSIFNYWNEIVGEKIAQKAQPSRFWGETLIISVCSHPWMTELTLMKPHILKKMHEKIKDCPFNVIRFEINSPGKK